MLRKELEKLVKDSLPHKELFDKNYEELDLAKMLARAIARSTGEARQILDKLNCDRKHILNPLSHDDDRNIFSQELKTAMVDLEKLKTLLK